MLLFKSPEASAQGGMAWHRQAPRGAQSGRPNPAPASAGHTKQTQCGAQKGPESRKRFELWKRRACAPAGDARRPRKPSEQEPSGRGGNGWCRPRPEPKRHTGTPRAVNRSEAQPRAVHRSNGFGDGAWGVATGSRRPAEYPARETQAVRGILWLKRS